MKGISKIFEYTQYPIHDYKKMGEQVEGDAFCIVR